ncbi:hypothetical protein MXB_4699, partial [Myxobolus squamalis]
MNSEEESSLDEYQIFCISVNLVKKPIIYKNEAPSFIHYITEKYLKKHHGISEIKNEYATNALLYDLNFLHLILKLFEDCDSVSGIFLYSSSLVELITSEFWSLVLSNQNCINCIIEKFQLLAQAPFTITISLKNKRRAQEDRTCSVHHLLLLNNRKDLLETPISIYGVFDGHRGAHASQYLSLNCFCGSTINLCAKYDKFLVFVNLGDSQSYLINEDGTFINTTPLLHELSVEGGTVEFKKGCYRLNGVFSLSRSFGNPDLSQFLNQEPDYIVHELTGNEQYVVIGSDGFWEKTDIELFSQKVSKCTDEGLVTSCLEEFVNEAIAYSQDN